MAVEYIRVLQCFSCKTLEVLPDYEGHPDGDEFLRKASEVHNRGGHLGNLLRVDRRDWDTPSTRDQLVEKIWESSGHSGFDPTFYATKDQYTYDAAVCYQKHNRPERCGDYKSDRMKLMPDTAAERKAAGLGKFQSNVFLCQFCSQHAVWRSDQYDKLGLRD